MLAALDTLPEKKLVASDLERDGAVCALGAVGKARGIALDAIDAYDRDTVAGTFGIPLALACEIMFENDEGTWCREEPEARFARVRAWVESKLIEWRELPDTE